MKLKARCKKFGAGFLLWALLLLMLPTLPARAAGTDVTNLIEIEEVTFSRVHSGKLYLFATATWNGTSYIPTYESGINIAQDDQVFLNIKWKVQEMNTDPANRIAAGDFFVMKFNTQGLFKFFDLISTPLEGIGNKPSHGRWEIDGASSTIKVTFNNTVDALNQLEDGYINVTVRADSYGSNVQATLNDEQLINLTVNQPTQGTHGPTGTPDRFAKSSHVHDPNTSSDKTEWVRWMISAYGDAPVQYYNGQSLAPLNNVVIEDTLTQGQTITPDKIAIQMVIRAPYIETSGQYDGRLFSYPVAYLSIKRHFTLVNGANYSSPLTFKEAVMEAAPAYGVFDNRYVVVAVGPMNDGNLPNALNSIQIIDSYVSNSSTYNSYVGDSINKLMSHAEYLTATASPPNPVVFSGVQRAMVADAYYNDDNAINGGIMHLSVNLDANASGVSSGENLENTVLISNEATIEAEISGNGVYAFTGAGVRGSYKGVLTLKKYDRDSGTPLAGVSFLLQRWDGSAWKYYTFTPQYTNAAGQIEISNLPDGRYKIVEVAPLLGYSDIAEYSPSDEFEIVNGDPSTEQITVTATNQRLPDVPGETDAPGETDVPGETDAPTETDVPAETAAGSPQTGDASNLPLWALCGTLSLLGLALCGVVLRKRFGRNAG